MKGVWDQRQRLSRQDAADNGPAALLSIFFSPFPSSPDDGDGHAGSAAQEKTDLLPARVPRLKMTNSGFGYSSHTFDPQLLIKVS